LKVMLINDKLADAPLTIASIDPCFSCTDRIYIVRNGVIEKFNLKPPGLNHRG